MIHAKDVTCFGLFFTCKAEIWTAYMALFMYCTRWAFFE